MEVTNAIIVDLEGKGLLRTKGCVYPHCPEIKNSFQLFQHFYCLRYQVFLALFRNYNRVALTHVNIPTGGANVSPAC